MKFYYEHISITAHRSEQEPERLIRLERVLGYVCALADEKGRENFLNEIANLHDYKGNLSVTWKTQTSVEEKDFFRKAWLSIIGDGSDHVQHVLASEQEEKKLGNS